MTAQRNETAMPWWARQQPSIEPAVERFQAVAYYRHSAQDRQENSVAIQQEQVQQWARANGVDIIHEFSDRGKSGLTAEGRDSFNDMMDNWVKKRNDFQFVLCLDVSRWGRFQDIDLSATYSAECKRNGKQVIYTTLGKPKPDDQLHQVYVQFERFRAAQYSKELSDKVFRGCVKISQQGYWAGGKPPYGFHRMLLDESRQPVQVLAPGQRKSIQNQRVTLAQGDERQVAAVKRIFREFTETLRTTREIAHGLNRDGIKSPNGGAWDGARVRRILHNEQYAGTMIYNKTTQKLKTPTRHNPKSAWVKTDRAFASIVDREIFQKAQQVLEQAAAQYTPEFMLEQLERLLRQHAFKREYGRILASIKATGLIEPLIVYPEGDGYVILDGVQRHRVLTELGAELAPCLMGKQREAFTGNRMVNRVSPVQENRMIEKSLEELDETTIAAALGISGISHRIRKTLLKQLHPDVAAAFDEAKLTRTCAKELTHVKSERQKEILVAMEAYKDFSLAFARALILKTPPAQRESRTRKKEPWGKNGQRKSDLLKKLTEAEQKHDFYSRLYKQYTVDLLRLAVYARSLIMNSRIRAYLDQHHAVIVERFERVIADAKE